MIYYKVQSKKCEDGIPKISVYPCNIAKLSSSRFVYQKYVPRHEKFTRTPIVLWVWNDTFSKITEKTLNLLNLFFSGLPPTWYIFRFSSFAFFISHISSKQFEYQLNVRLVNSECPGRLHDYKTLCV